MLGAWFAGCLLAQEFAAAILLAGCSKATAYFRQRQISLGLSLSTVWRTRLSINSAMG
jgi:hypothetical protein